MKKLKISLQSSELKKAIETCNRKKIAVFGMLISLVIIFITSSSNRPDITQNEPDIPYIDSEYNDNDLDFDSPDFEFASVFGVSTLYVNSDNELEDFYYVNPEINKEKYVMKFEISSYDGKDIYFSSSYLYPGDEITSIKLSKSLRENKALLFTIMIYDYNSLNILNTIDIDIIINAI